MEKAFHVRSIRIATRAVSAHLMATVAFVSRRQKTCDTSADAALAILVSVNLMRD